jgi:uncharacterized protein (UPF0332 family)
VSDVKQDLIRYRLQRAQEMLEDGELLLRAGRLTSATNRIYYAMFYATSALLATKNLSSSRHSGIIALLHDHFVRPGVFPRELAKQLSLAFEMRNDSDYDDFVTPEQSELTEMLGNARSFVRTAVELVESRLPQDPSPPA